MAKITDNPDGTFGIDFDPGEFDRLVDEQEDGAFDMAAQIAKLSGLGIEDTPGELMIMSVLHLEEEIISKEHYNSTHTDKTDVERARIRYVQTRAKAKKELGDRFQEVYMEVKEEENECARANLGMSNGTHGYVLPLFYDDGTHEPWGESDVPWNSP